MNINAINQFKYAQPTFKSMHEIENKPFNNPNGSLCHMSNFFRYKDNFSLIGNILKQNFPDEELNVVSAGCSYGEEVYSLAMTFEEMGLKPKITGVDIASYAIDAAKAGRYYLDCLDIKEIYGNYNSQEKTKAAVFDKNFERINEISEITKYHPEYTCNCYKKRKGTFKNCNFKQGDIKELSKMFKENSVNAITCNNVLYHLISREDSPEKIKQTFLELFKEFSKILKPKGILSFESSNMQEAIEAMEEIGEFKQLDKYGRMWQKKETNCLTK